MTHDPKSVTAGGTVTRARKVRPKLAAITRGHAHPAVTG